MIIVAEFPRSEISFSHNENIHLCHVLVNIKLTTIRNLLPFMMRSVRKPRYNDAWFTVFGILLMMRSARKTRYNDARFTVFGILLMMRSARKTH